MPDTETINIPFSDPDTTAGGETRASVPWDGLKTLWLNTGTLCNIECENCYILSSPKNDRLVYLKQSDVMPFLEEIDRPIEIGITGGEPFMCPEILEIMEAVLSRGHELLVLTNAMRPMMRPRIQDGLLRLHERFADQLTLRVSMDSHMQALHDAERGAGAFEEALKGLSWLAGKGVKTTIAGRHASLREDEATARMAYGALAARIGLALNAEDPKQLVLFPEMTPRDNPPEITTACWNILSVDPASIMCASQRMVIRRKGASRATVTACTLLVDDLEFELGHTLAEATRAPVKLNHPWCATFCVLGGASCSA